MNADASSTGAIAPEATLETTAEPRHYQVSSSFLLARNPGYKDSARGDEPLPLLILNPVFEGLEQIEADHVVLDAMWVVEQTDDVNGPPKLDAVDHIASWTPTYDDGGHWVVIVCSSGRTYVLESGRLRPLGEVSRDWERGETYIRMAKLKTAHLPSVDPRPVHTKEPSK